MVFRVVDLVLTRNMLPKKESKNIKTRLWINNGGALCRCSIRIMNSRRAPDRDTRARLRDSRPGRDRPRPSVAEAARLTRAAGKDRRYGGRPDAEVMLALGGWGALESWACAQKIAATQEMIRRRPDRRAVPAAGAGPDQDALPAVWDRTLSEELALELSSSVYSGQALAELSYALGSRLPLTAAALEDGVLDMGKVRLIAGETAVLTDEQARAAEAEIAGQWDGLTWGELRDLVTAAVINADPEGARKRREEASKDARYRFCLDRGALTATLAGYSLPPADAIRADQRVRARARGYRRHGIEGTFDQLCALAYLDLLTGRDARDRIPQGPVPDEDAEAEEAAWASRLADGPGPADSEDAVFDDGPVPDDPDAAALAGLPCPDQPAGPDEPAEHAGPDGPAGSAGLDEPATESRNDNGDVGRAGEDDSDARDGDRDARDAGDGDGEDDDDGGQGGTGDGPGPEPEPRPGGGGAGACDDGLAANVDLIVPLADLTGYAQRAGQVRNLGGIDPELARTLAGMAVRNPGSVFRVIVTGPDGRATAFGQATPITPVTRPLPDRHTEGTQLPLPSSELAGGTPDSPAMPLATFTPASGSPDPSTGLDGTGQWRLRIGTTMYTVRLDPVPGPGPCTHHYQGAGYQPGPVLRRLTEVRDGTCMLPCCNRSPRRCESEHCQPWPAGATCSCNLGLNCKKHNLMKKDPRWQVTQEPDGTRTWTTPAGLRYTSKPKTYPS
jgi:hypothetical protein